MHSIFDPRSAVRAGLLQLVLVAALAVLLAVLLPKSFFREWGWLSGPVAWLGCAWLTATILDLPRLTVIAGALAAGIPALIAVVIGIHWLGTLLAVIAFAIWCGLALGRSRHVRTG